MPQTELQKVVGDILGDPGLDTYEDPSKLSYYFSTLDNFFPGFQRHREVTGVEASERLEMIEMKRFVGREGLAGVVTFLRFNSFDEHYQRFGFHRGVNVAKGLSLPTRALGMYLGANKRLSELGEQRAEMLFGEGEDTTSSGNLRRLVDEAILCRDLMCQLAEGVMGCLRPDRFTDDKRQLVLSTV